MPISGLRPTPTKTAATTPARTVTRPSWIKDGPTKTETTTATSKSPSPSPAKSPTPVNRKFGLKAMPTTDAKPPTAKTPAAKTSVASNGTKDTKTVPNRTTTFGSKKVPEPVTKKPVVVEEDDDSSEYEYVTDSEATESGSEDEIEEKFKLPIEVKLKPVEKPPPKIQKSPSQERAGKFIKPTLKKVPKIDEEIKEKEPPKNELPEKAVLRKVEVPLMKEPKENENKFVRPPLKRVDSTTKRSK